MTARPPVRQQLRLARLAPERPRLAPVSRLALAHPVPVGVERLRPPPAWLGRRRECRSWDGRRCWFVRCRAWGWRRRLLVDTQIRCKIFGIVAVRLDHAQAQAVVAGRQTRGLPNPQLPIDHRCRVAIEVDIRVIAAGIQLVVQFVFLEWLDHRRAKHRHVAADGRTRGGRCDARRLLGICRREGRRAYPDQRQKEDRGRADQTPEGVLDGSVWLQVSHCCSQLATRLRGEQQAVDLCL